MTDKEILDWLEAAIQVGTAKIEYKDDDSEEDDWGIIPEGFSICIRACKEYDVSATTLRQCVEQAVKEEKRIDDIGE